YSFVGSLACFAVYGLIQFGVVQNLNERVVAFGGANGRTVSFNSVQFACDRLITAAFFLLKQAFRYVSTTLIMISKADNPNSGYFYPGTFVTMRQLINKEVVIPGSSAVQEGADGDSALVVQNK